MKHIYITILFAMIYFKIFPQHNPIVYKAIIQKEEIIVFKEYIESDVLHIDTSNIKITKRAFNYNEKLYFLEPDSFPYFSNRSQSIKKYICDSIINKIDFDYNFRLIVLVLISENGNIDNVFIIHSTGEIYYNYLVIQKILQMPTWHPAILNKKRVNSVSYFSIYIIVVR